MCSPCGFAMKSPVTVSRALYASSAKEQVKSSLGAVRMPSNTLQPVGDIESCSKGSLQVTVKILDQAICLHVVCHCVVKLGA